MKPVYISFLVLALAVSNSQCLECYVCRDINTGPCFAPRQHDMAPVTCTFDTTTKSDIGKLLPGLSPNKTDVDWSNKAFEPVCFMLQMSAGGEKLVQRGCSPQDFMDALCVEYHNSPGVSVEYCSTCATDRCNSAENAKMSRIALMAAVVVSILVGS